MYVPSVYRSPSREAELKLMREHPLATLVWHDGRALQATPLPLLLRGESVLAAHLPRANPLVAHLQHGEAPLMAVFMGPEGYVSPSWTPTKAETHRVVPTWNYATVHAHGPARLVEDAGWVRAQLDELTARQEAALPAPWAVADAPPDYIAQLMRVLVGLELHIEHLDGKFKLSQKDDRDRLGAAAVLASTNPPLAALMRGEG